MTKLRLLQTDESLQTTILNMMRMVEISPNGSKAISPFPTVFSKDMYCRQVKTMACLGKG